MSLPESDRSRVPLRDPSVTLIIGAMIAMIGILLGSTAEHTYIFVWGTNVFVPRAVGYLAASLFVAAAGLISTGLTIHGRARASSAAVQPSETPLDQADPSWYLPPAWLGGWPHVVTAVLFGVLALMTVIASWSNDDQGALPVQTQQVFGGLLILLAFPFLVIERIYANTAGERLPEAPQLERLLRVPLVAFLGLGITSVLTSVGLDWPSVIERAIAALIGLVSLELVLRGAATMFLPDQPVGRRRSCADSTIAGLLRLTPPTLVTFGTAVKRQFGIDLSRSWALAFVRRAALPIGLGIGVVAWCLTGLTALSLSERAVYERLGAPVAILGPGLHIHLPWPFGILRPVELGVVHEMPIILAPTGEAASGNPVEPITRVEDVPPASADRLWDTSHPGEASYLIASESQGKQSFQIVNIDLRVVYRIGLSDAAAKQAAYAVADPEALIRAMAGQLLVRYFARYTLLDVLVQSRERFATTFRNELQSGLQNLSTGIDVIAVIVEAIHPPPGAANAYHNVQAAEIYAHSEIAWRQAEAIKQMKRAQQSATEGHNDAVAAASERVNQAHAESVLFDGDRQAHQHDGVAFLLERWLSHLSGALQKSGLVLIDHRLKGMTAPTVDLRSFDLPGATATFSPTSRVTAQPQGSQTPQGQQAAPSGQQEDEGDRD